MQKKERNQSIINAFPKWHCTKHDDRDSETSVQNLCAKRLNECIINGTFDFHGTFFDFCPLNFTISVTVQETEKYWKIFSRTSINTHTLKTIKLMEAENFQLDKIIHFLCSNSRPQTLDHMNMHLNCVCVFNMFSGCWFIHMRKSLHVHFTYNTMFPHRQLYPLFSASNRRKLNWNKKQKTEIMKNSKLYFQWRRTLRAERERERKRAWKGKILSLNAHLSWIHVN